MKYLIFHSLKHRLSAVLLLSVAGLVLLPHIVFAQGIDTGTQKNIDTLQDYYRAVQKKAGTMDARQPVPKTVPAAANRHKPEEFSPPVETRYATPISGEGNTLTSAYTPAGRDPFAVTPVMLENEKFTLKREIDFIPLQGDFKIPNMRLKGVITGASEHDKLTALLEIEGLGVFVVREGDTVGLQGIGNGRDVILIESITRLSLVVRTGSYGGTAEKRFVIR